MCSCYHFTEYIYNVSVCYEGHKKCTKKIFYKVIILTQWFELKLTVCIVILKLNDNVLQLYGKIVKVILDNLMFYNCN